MTPTQQNLFFPILEVLMQEPAGMMLSRLYKKLEPYFPEMSRADFDVGKTGEKPENAWRLTVRWAKKKMTYDHKWMVANLPRGMCQISNAGRKAYDTLKISGWSPRYSDPELKSKKKEKKQQELQFLKLAPVPTSAPEAIPFVAIDGERLNEVADLELVEGVAVYPCSCGLKHPIKSGHGSGTTLQYYTCGHAGKTFLVGIDGKSLLH